MAMRPQTQADLVRTYIELIQAEREKLEAALEAIQEYAKKLHDASADAQQRLIGRS